MALIVLLGLALILLPGLGYSEIPQQINYQGYLTNAAGVPVNGTVEMVFSFYLAATGGSPIWHETQNVTVNKGVYNVILGDVTPISLPFGLPYYLGVKVGTDPEMTPRQPLTSCGVCLSGQCDQYGRRDRNLLEFDRIDGRYRNGPLAGGLDDPDTKLECRYG